MLTIASAQTFLAFVIKWQTKILQSGGTKLFEIKDIDKGMTRFSYWEERTYIQ